MEYHLKHLNTFLTMADESETVVGSQPPTGYVAWHEWAEAQIDAGLKQARCAMCALWRFPQEMSGRTVTSRPQDDQGRVIEIVSPVCKACDTQAG